MEDSIRPARREKINIMVTPEERKIITEKAIEYGYGDKLAEYVRDACIYERVYVEELSGKKEICKIVSDFITSIKDILKVQSNISKNITIPKSDIESIKKQNIKISELIEELTRTIVSTLSSNSVPKFQTRLRLVEKNKVTKDFIDYVIKKKFVIAIPSTLGIKKPKDGILLVSLDNKEALNIETLETDNSKTIINSQREKALKNKCYLFFSTEDNKLYIFLADYYKKEDDGLNEYQTRIQNGMNIKLYNCSTKGEVKVKEG